MRKFIHVIFICIIFTVFYTGCATIGENKSALYNVSADELDKISQSENLTPEQKVIIKHASINLKQAEKAENKVSELQEKLVKESKLAGAGKMIYTIIFFIAFCIISYIGFKILKRFYII